MRPGGWLHERLSFALRRPVPDVGPTTWTALPDGVLPVRRGRRPEVTAHIPQSQSSDNATPDLQEGVFARVAALPGVSTGQSAISVPGARGFFVGSPRGPGDAFLVPSAGEFAHLHPEDAASPLAADQFRDGE